MEPLHLLADELRETFSERGHAIEKALDGDPAFTRTRRSQSSLVRDLVLSGILEATSRLGLSCIPVTGGSLDVQTFMGGADCRFRVLKANVAHDSNAYEIVGNDSIMLITDSEPDSLYPVERWILGYTVAADGMLAQIFAAKVLGLSSDSVPRVILGAVTELGTVPQAPLRGFHPQDEDELDGLEDLEDGDHGSGTVAG